MGEEETKVMEETSEEKVEFEEDAVKEETETPKKKVAAKRGRKKGSKNKKPKEKVVEYEGMKLRGVELNGDGKLRLKEPYYYALTVSEQNVKIHEKDLDLARLRELAYRKEIDSRLPIEVQRELSANAAAVQDANTKLAVARKQYRDEAKAVEEETGLVLKKWLVDDMRVMRLIEKLKQE